MADMHMGRGSLCTAMQGFMLWAVGGRDSHTFHNSTECFHAGQNRWTWGPSTNTKRFAAASASLHNAIYITGGFDATMYTATAERMDPREGKWSPVCHPLLWCCIMPVSVVTDIMTSTAEGWEVDLHRKAKGSSICVYTSISLITILALYGSMFRITQKRLPQLHVFQHS